MSVRFGHGWAHSSIEPLCSFVAHIFRHVAIVCIMQLKENPPSIFKSADAPPSPRFTPSKEQPRYPDTKHTLTCALSRCALPELAPHCRCEPHCTPLCRQVVHNIAQYPVTPAVGKETYNPVLMGGHSVRRRYDGARGDSLRACPRPDASALSLLACIPRTSRARLALVW